MTREVMQQALDALTMPCDRWNATQSKIVNEAIEALRAELDRQASWVPTALVVTDRPTYTEAQAAEVLKLISEYFACSISYQSMAVKLRDILGVQPSLF